MKKKGIGKKGGGSHLRRHLERFFDTLYSVSLRMESLGRKGKKRKKGGKEAKIVSDRI